MSEDHADFVKASEKILGVIVTGWDKGREALVFLLIGTASIIGAFWLVILDRELLAIAFLLIGLITIGIVGYKFYFDAVVPARVASQNIERNSELIDSIQDAAITLTELITLLNDYALSNADSIVTVVDNAKGALSRLPGGQLIANSEYFTKGDNLARGIRRIAAGSRDVVKEVQDSIAKADVKKITTHIANLKQVREMIEAELMS